MYCDCINVIVAGAKFECPSGKHRVTNVGITSCECMLSYSDQERYEEVIRHAENASENGDELRAINCYEQALRLADHNPRIAHAALSLLRKHVV